MNSVVVKRYELYTRLVKLHEQANQVYLLINAIDNVMLDIYSTEVDGHQRRTKLVLLKRNKRDREIEGCLLIGNIITTQKQLLQIYENYFFSVEYQV